jgi:hypothetical protein
LHSLWKLYRKLRGLRKFWWIEYLLFFIFLRSGLLYMQRQLHSQPWPFKLFNISMAISLLWSKFKHSCPKKLPKVGYNHQSSATFLSWAGVFRCWWLLLILWYVLMPRFRMFLVLIINVFMLSGHKW